MTLNTQGGKDVIRTTWTIGFLRTNLGVICASAFDQKITPIFAIRASSFIAAFLCLVRIGTLDEVRSYHG